MIRLTASNRVQKVNSKIWVESNLKIGLETRLEDSPRTRQDSDGQAAAAAVNKQQQQRWESSSSGGLKIVKALGKQQQKHWKSSTGKAALIKQHCFTKPVLL